MKQMFWTKPIFSQCLPPGCRKGSLTDTAGASQCSATFSTAHHFSSFLSLQSWENLWAALGQFTAQNWRTRAGWVIIHYLCSGHPGCMEVRKNKKCVWEPGLIIQRMTSDIRSKIKLEGGREKEWGVEISSMKLCWHYVTLSVWRQGTYLQNVQRIPVSQWGKDNHEKK